jgi:hypothetical protein
MGGLTTIPLLPAAELAGMGAVRVFASQGNLTSAPAGHFRPPQWAEPALYMITIPPPYVNTPATSTGITDNGAPSDQGAADGAVANFTMSVNVKPPPPTAQAKNLVFDGVMRSSHSQRARPTRNPIQTGANLTNHILLDPANVTLDVYMTDVLPAFAEGQWVGNTSKSISCFMVLDALRAARVPVTLTTRLKTYTNMVLVDILPDESNATRYAFKARVEFEQIFVGQVATVTYSARPQTTGDTALGTTQVTQPTQGVVSQNGLPSAATGAPTSSILQQQTGTVQGAGNWSSNNTAGLGTLIGSALSGVL